MKAMKNSFREIHTSTIVVWLFVTCLQAWGSMYFKDLWVLSSKDLTHQLTYFLSSTGLCLVHPFSQKILFFKYFIYLFPFRERGREGEREGEKQQCATDQWFGCLPHTPNQGVGRQPGHVPWPGIKPATFWVTGQHSVHWATPARAKYSNFERKRHIINLEPRRL